MKLRLLLVICLLAQLAIAQSANEEDLEYTEEAALYNAKAFTAFYLIDHNSDSVTRFSLVPLEAAKSAEMTTLYFKCESQGKEGLLLGFNGQQDQEGRLREASDFYYLPKKDALEFLNRIIDLFETEDDFLSDEKDQNNGLFQYGDLKVIIYRGGDETLRIFWNGFDAAWELGECEDTLKEFQKAMED